MRPMRVPTGWRLRASHPSRGIRQSHRRKTGPRTRRRAKRRVGGNTAGQGLRICPRPWIFLHAKKGGSMSVEPEPQLTKQARAFFSAERPPTCLPPSARRLENKATICRREAVETPRAREKFEAMLAQVLPTGPQVRDFGDAGGNQMRLSSSGHPSHSCLRWRG